MANLADGSGMLLDAYQALVTTIMAHMDMGGNARGEISDRDPDDWRTRLEFLPSDGATPWRLVRWSDTTKTYKPIPIFEPGVGLLNSFKCFYNFRKWTTDGVGSDWKAFLLGFREHHARVRNAAITSSVRDAWSNSTIQGTYDSYEVVSSAYLRQTGGVPETYDEARHREAAIDLDITEEYFPFWLTYEKPLLDLLFGQFTRAYLYLCEARRLGMTPTILPQNLHVRLIQDGVTVSSDFCASWLGSFDSEFHSLLATTDVNQLNVVEVVPGYLHQDLCNEVDFEMAYHRLDPNPVVVSANLRETSQRIRREKREEQERRREEQERRQEREEQERRRYDKLIDREQALLRLLKHNQQQKATSMTEMRHLNKDFLKTDELLARLALGGEFTVFCLFQFLTHLSSGETGQFVADQVPGDQALVPLVHATMRQVPGDQNQDPVHRRRVRAVRPPTQAAAGQVHVDQGQAPVPRPPFRAVRPPAPAAAGQVHDDQVQAPVPRQRFQAVREFPVDQAPVDAGQVPGDQLFENNSVVSSALSLEVDIPQPYQKSAVKLISKEDTILVLPNSSKDQGIVTKVTFVERGWLGYKIHYVDPTTGCPKVTYPTNAIRLEHPHNDSAAGTNNFGSFRDDTESDDESGKKPRAKPDF